MSDKEYFEQLWQKNMMKRCGCIVPTIKLAIITLIIVLLSSCATKARIEYHDRDVNHCITNTVHDTLIDKTTDSVYVNKYVKGDTTYLEKYKYMIRWRERIVERHDTCWRDSVVTQIKETTNEVIKIPKIYKFSLLFSILCFIFVIVKALRRWL